MHELLGIFARSIHTKVSGLKELETTPTSEQTARLLESISDDIRKCTDFIPVFVSKSAKVEAERLVPPVNLFGETWHSQPRFDKGRRIFQFEHVVPVSSVRELCLESECEEAVFAILSTRLKVAWILKSENDRLNELGYTVERPDPEAAYREAGITLIPPGNATTR